MTTTQTSVRLTEATLRQIDDLLAQGYGTKTDIIRLAIDRMHSQEAEVNTESVTVKVGRAWSDRNGLHWGDDYRPVTFEGEKIADTRHLQGDDDTRGTDYSLYRTSDGLILHRYDWSRWPGESDEMSLHRVTPSQVQEISVSLAREAGLDTELALEDALSPL